MIRGLSSAMGRFGSTYSPLNDTKVSVETVVPPAASANRTRTKVNEPTSILIFGWNAAPMSALQKYGDAYRQLYPCSTQVIIQPDALRFWKFGGVRERALLPAVQKLKEIGILSPTSENPPRILIHVMSNGGLMCLSDIVTILRKRNVQSPPGTKCALILDSTPAPLTLATAFRATMAGMGPGALQKLTGGALIFVVYFLTFVARTLLRRPTLTTREMAAINNPALLLLPWTSAATAAPRMYLYSTADAVIPASSVEAHAADARRAGFPVQMVDFRTSAHVSHARDYPEKYWGAVETFWAGAMRLYGGNEEARVGIPGEQRSMPRARL